MATTSFDPDKYLAEVEEVEFDPDTYLAEVDAAEPEEESPVQQAAAVPEEKGTDESHLPKLGIRSVPVVAKPRVEKKEATKAEVEKLLGLDKDKPFADLPTVYDDVEDPSEFAKGAKVGAQEAAIGQELPSVEEMEEPKGAAGFAGRIVGNIATDVGISLAAGVAAGPGAPVVSALTFAGLAMARAWRTEQIQAKYQGRETSLKNVPLNLATELNPMLRYGGKTVARALKKGATQAALQTGQLAQGGGVQDAQTLAIGAVIGGFAGAATSGKRASPLTPVEAVKTKKVRNIVDFAEVSSRPSKYAPDKVPDKELEKQLAGVAENLADNNVTYKLEKAVLDNKDSLPLPVALREMLETSSTFQKTKPEKILDDLNSLNAADFQRKYGVALNTGEVLPGEVDLAAGLYRQPKRQITKGKARIGYNDKDADVVAEMIDERNARFMNRMLQKETDILGEVPAPTFKKMKELYNSHGAVNDDVYAAWQGQNIKLREVHRMIQDGELAPGDWSKTLGKASYWADDFYMNRRIDQLTNGATSMSAVFSDAVEASQRLSVEMMEYVGTAKKLQKIFREAGLKDTTKIPVKIHNKDYTFSLREIIEDADITAGPKRNIEAALPAEQREAIKLYREALSDFRASVNARHGMAVPEYGGGAEGYFPHMTTDTVQLARQMRKILAVGPKHPQYKEVLDSVERITGTPITKNNLKQLVDSVATMDSAKAKGKLEPGHALHREDRIPAFQLEEDPFKAFQRYTSATLSAVHYRKTVDKFRENLAILDSLKPSNPEIIKPLIKRVKDQMQVTMGGYESKVAKMESLAKKTENFFAKVIDAEGSGFANDFKKATAKTAIHAPQLFSTLLHSAYPNLIGFNIRAPIRNLSQTMMLTAPELGTDYGYRTVAKSWASALNHVRKGKGVGKFLQKKGLQSGDVFSEIASPSERGLPTLPGGVLKGFDAFNKVGMSLYQLSDNINRLITYHVGQNMAKDLFKGNAAVMKYVQNRLPKVTQAKLALALKSKQHEEVGKILSRYLIEKTQFIYNKHSRSTAAKDYGMLASMFMKWPQMVSGEMTEMIRDKRFGPFIQTYVIPTALMGYAAYQLKEAGAFENPVGRVLLGKSWKNVFHYSPALSPLNIGVNPIGNAMGAMIGLPLGGLEGEGETAAKDVWKSFEPFLPPLKPLKRAVETYQEFTQPSLLKRRKKRRGRGFR